MARDETGQESRHQIEKDHDVMPRNVEGILQNDKEAILKIFKPGNDVVHVLLIHELLEQESRQ